MLYCSVDGCFSNNKYGNAKRTLFRCPMKHLERALKWHKFCGDPTLKFHKGLFICDLHFLKTDFYIGENQKLYLKSYAIPCLNGPKKNEDNSKCEPDVESIKSQSLLLDQEQYENLLGNSSLNISQPSSSLQYLNKSIKNISDDALINNIKTSSKVVTFQKQARKTLSDIIRPIDPKVKISILKPVSSLPKTAKVVPINIITNTDGSKVFVPVSSKLNTEKAHLQTCSKPNHFLKENQEFNTIENTSLTSSQSLKRQNEDTIEHTSSKVFKRSNAHFEITLHHDIKSKETEEENTSICDAENDVFTETRKTKISYDYGLDFDVKVKTSIEFKTDNKLSEYNNAPTSRDSTDENFDSGGTYYDLSLLNQKSRHHVYGDKKKGSYTPTISDEPLPNTCSGATDHRTTSPLSSSTFNKRTPVFNSYSKKIRTPVNLNDPKFSIAATADSLGTFNSFIEKPLEQVDVKNNEWNKLFISSGLKYPKLTKSHIGSMVNQLREKLPRLNEKDMLDVLFILNMMSIYPSVPEKIKEEMFQRLCMVFIATMFKWDTALALAQRVRENNSVTGSISEPNDFETTNSATGENNTGSQKDQSKLKTIPKHPKFPFELIVYERPKGKKT